MFYAENKEKSGEYLRLALAYITQYKLTPNPSNYAIWYEYVSGKNKKLSQTIDYMMAHNKKFNNENLSQIYQTCMADNYKMMMGKIFSGLKKIIISISSYLVETNGEFVKHNNKMQSISTKLDKINDEFDDLGVLNNIFDEMAQELKNIIKSSTGLHTHIEESSQDFEDLKKKFKETQRAAETDVLTGLVNRRKFETVLDYEITQAITQKKALSLIMIDIDFFKKINDTFGHLTGDSVLKTMASLFKKQLKGKDIAARFGGEEFIIILPETCLEDAYTVADNLRLILAKKVWRQKTSGKNMGTITISLGVAQYKQGETKRLLINRVDKALYFAKQNGRNKVASEKDINSSKEKLSHAA